MSRQSDFWTRDAGGSPGWPYIDQCIRDESSVGVSLEAGTSAGSVDMILG